MPESNSEM
jgi:succinate-semialdehyde dehydrogenase/glutarate-semialdehyde dehydrogenase